MTVSLHHASTFRWTEPVSSSTKHIEAERIISQHRSLLLSINRDVYIGWVANWDDAAKQFLVLFDKNFQLSSTGVPQIIEEIEHETPFALFEQETSTKHTVIGRKSQQRFKFQVLKRYGPKCAVCEMDVLALLQAAHLVPREHHGSYDPRNGFVFCANHHLAFDANLFAINPKTLELCYRTSGPDARSLQISAKDLQHLKNLPHGDALTWRYQYWVQSNRG